MLLQGRFSYGIVIDGVKNHTPFNSGKGALIRMDYSLDGK